MNRNYIYNNGEIIIEDTENNIKKEEYYDNIDKVLIEENVIETLENIIDKLEKESENYTTEKKKIFFPIYTVTGVGAILLSPLLFNFFSLLSGEALIVESAVGQFSIEKIYMILMLTLYTPFVALIDNKYYTAYKEKAKKKRAINSQLEYLKNTLILRKKRLEELKSDKNKCLENTEFRKVEVNDQNDLNVLKNKLTLIYSLSFNFEKYYKLYQKGKLEKSLKSYNEYEITFASDFLEENGPKLSKKKKNKKS